MRKKGLRTYQVCLSEQRQLTCYIDAASRDEALQETLKTWRKQNADQAYQLPFEVNSAELAQPATARTVGADSACGGTGEHDTHA